MKQTSSQFQKTTMRVSDSPDYHDVLVLLAAVIEVNGGRVDVPEDVLLEIDRDQWIETHHDLDHLTWVLTTRQKPLPAGPSLEVSESNQPKCPKVEWRNPLTYVAILLWTMIWVALAIWAFTQY